MKFKFIDDIRDIVEQSKTWAKLELEYAKLTVAEKATVLMTSLILIFVCLLLGMVVLILLALSLSELFMLLMSPALAYLSVAGIICLLLVLLFVCRKPLLLNPLARMFTKVIFENKKD